MFLILETQPTDFGRRLESAAEHQGLRTLVLTSAEIANSLQVAFCLSEQAPHLCLHYQDITIETCDIEGVYCSINAFDPGLWERFSPKDAEYAAQETQALWLAILASLPGQVVNPPALDTLAGTVLSTPEILYLAHCLGFQIPMSIDLESGMVTVELLERGISAHYADLGDIWIKEAGLTQSDLTNLAQNKNHFRVKEEVSGKLVCITLLGKQSFACQLEADNSVTSLPNCQVPRPIRKRLRALQKRLNLNLAEYYFRLMADHTWVFIGCDRLPTFTVASYGDVLFEQIIDYVTEKGG